MKSDDWRGLYREGWKGEIVAGAFAHPAKYARALVRRIFEHAAAEGWVRPGDGVVDPFGGVALGALDAMRLGLHWHGVELEPRFVALGNENIAAWNARYGGRFARWGTARLAQGDSRNLADVLTGWQTLAVSSPPYASSDQDYKGGWARFHNGHEPLWREDSQREAHYGETPGQLAAMPEGKFDLAVSSPPYAADEKHDYTHDQRDDRRGKKQGRGSLRGQYGKADGQIAAMPAGDFELAVSSPPFEKQVPSHDNFVAAHDTRRRMDTGTDAYGDTPGQLGATGADDFWTAARAIVEQTYAVLAPGGHACWVVKDFVRNKQRVEFSDQWRRLCEAVGFRTLHLHRAWVVEHRGTQYGPDGERVTTTVERKSFFRRLAEKKGSPRIDWEVVLCMEKPL